MKFIIICSILIFLLANSSLCQVNSDKLENDSDRLIKLKLTVFENSKDGRKFKIYLFSKTKLRIYEKPFDTQNYKEHLYTEHKFKSKELFREVSKLNLDTLNKLYYNNCVDSNKGYDYSIIIESKSKTTSIMLHHYYVMQVDALTVLLNKSLPKTFHIIFLSKENKQDCGKLD